MNSRKNLLTGLACGMFLLLSVIQPNICKSQNYSEGPNHPASATQENAGCVPCTGSNWGSYINITSPDNVCTQSTLSQHPICFQTNCFFSRGLKASNFGFTIPSSAIITGIVAEVLRKASDPLSVKDSAIQLMRGLTPVGNNMASADFWTTTSTYEVYGNSSDVWGATLTPTDVNSSGFGIFYRTENMNSGISSVTAYVDYVRMTVYFSTSLGVTESQVSDHAFSLFYDAPEEAISIRTTNLKSPSTHMVVFNAIGQVVLSKDLKNNVSGVSIEKIKTGELPEGIYIVQLSSDDQVFSRKIMISEK